MAAIPSFPELKSYREPLDRSQERGNLLFAPCGVPPTFGLDIGSRGSLDSIGAEFQLKKLNTQKSCDTLLNRSNLNTPPVGNIVAHIDDRDSAGQFSKDPSYHEIVAHRWDDSQIANPALQVYHLEKSLQRNEGALLDTFDIIFDSGLHRNDYRQK